jgi:hypothetical protein
MGYRSHVTAVIYPGEPEDPLGPDAYKEYETRMYEALRFLMGTKYAQLMEMQSGWFGSLAQWDDREKRLVFEMHDVKWYESYEDVKAFDAMLIEVTELGYCSEFVRVGEESDDIENRYEGEGLKYILNVQRTITID